MFSHLHLIFLLLLLLLIVILLLLLVLLLSGGLLSGILLALGCLWVSLLLAWSDAAPLGQLGLRSLIPLGQFVLPHALQPLGSHDLSSALVQLLPVAAEGLGVQTLLDGFVSQLELSPLVQFFELIVL